jgi:hypothetical protein
MLMLARLRIDRRIDPHAIGAPRTGPRVASVEAFRYGKIAPHVGESVATNGLRIQTVSDGRAYLALVEIHLMGAGVCETNIELKKVPLIGTRDEPAQRVKSPVCVAAVVRAGRIEWAWSPAIDLCTTGSGRRLGARGRHPSIPGHTDERVQLEVRFGRSLRTGRMSRLEIKESSGDR